MFKPYIVKVFCKKGRENYELTGFGRDVDDYVWAKTAKRLVMRKFGVAPEYLENTDLQLVDLTDMHNDEEADEAKKEFKLNIKTVPCYVYKCEL